VLSSIIHWQATDANTRKADNVYVLFCAFKIFKMIEHPTDCEIRSLVRFLNVRNVEPADIHRQICEVCGENGMSDGMVRKWVSKFNEGRDKVHDEPRSGRPSVVSGAFTGGHVLRQGNTETGARYDKCLNNGGNYVEK
jgi:hypothetical protein